MGHSLPMTWADSNGRGDLGSCPSAAPVFPRAVRHLRWPLVAGLGAAEIPGVTDWLESQRDGGRGAGEFVGNNVYMICNIYDMI